MTRRRGLLLLLDRALRPRGWARTAPIDPELPIRGRYLSVVLQVPVQGPRMAATRLPDGEAQLFPPLAFFLPEQGEPRPIRLGVRCAGQCDPLSLPLP